MRLKNEQKPLEHLVADFQRAAGDGQVEALEHFAIEAPEQLQQMISADNFNAFRIAAQNRRFEVIKCLVKIAPQQLLSQMFSANNYDVFRTLACPDYKKHILLSVLKSGKYSSALFNDSNHHSFCEVFKNPQLNSIKFLLSFAKIFGYAEMHFQEKSYAFREYSFLVNQQINNFLTHLQQEMRSFQDSYPTRVFDFLIDENSVNEERGLYGYYALRQLIRQLPFNRYGDEVYTYISLLLAIPSIKTLVLLNATQTNLPATHCYANDNFAEQTNELLRLAAYSRDKQVTQQLLAIPNISIDETVISQLLKQEIKIYYMQRFQSFTIDELISIQQDIKYYWRTFTETACLQRLDIQDDTFIREGLIKLLTEERANAWFDAIPGILRPRGYGNTFFIHYRIPTLDALDSLFTQFISQKQNPAKMLSQIEASLPSAALIDEGTLVKMILEEVKNALHDYKAYHTIHNGVCASVLDSLSFFANETKNFAKAEDLCSFLQSDVRKTNSLRHVFYTLTNFFEMSSQIFYPHSFTNYLVKALAKLRIIRPSTECYTQLGVVSELETWLANYLARQEEVEPIIDQVKLDD